MSSAGFFSKLIWRITQLESRLPITYSQLHQKREHQRNCRISILDYFRIQHLPWILKCKKWSQLTPKIIFRWRVYLYISKECDKAMWNEPRALIKMFLNSVRPFILRKVEDDMSLFQTDVGDLTIAFPAYLEQEVALLAPFFVSVSLNAPADYSSRTINRANKNWNGTKSTTTIVPKHSFNNEKENNFISLFMRSIHQITRRLSLYWWFCCQRGKRKALVTRRTQILWFDKSSRRMIG